MKKMTKKNGRKKEEEKKKEEERKNLDSIEMRNGCATFNFLSFFLCFCHNHDLKSDFNHEKQNRTKEEVGNVANKKGGSRKTRLIPQAFQVTSFDQQCLFFATYLAECQAESP